MRLFRRVRRSIFLWRLCIEKPQVFWNRMIVDVLFREGKGHSNHGTHVVRIITELVRLIRSHYNENGATCVVADTEFYDQRLFVLCDRLYIAFIVGGEICKNILDTTRVDD